MAHQTDPVPRSLTRTEARRIAVAAQLLTADRLTGLVTTAERLTLLQLDPTAVVAPTADLVAWSRLGEAYRPEHLRAALEVDRTMFEHRHREDPSSGNIAAVRPMSAIRWYRAEMDQLRTTPGTVRDWLDANAAFERRVIDQIAAEGPLSSKAIPDTADVPWKSTGWTDGRNVTQLLEFLASRGVVAVAGRDGKQRLWDLADRVYPEDDDPLTVDEAVRQRDAARLRSQGLARPKHVGEAGVEVTVEGTDRVWRLDPDATADGFRGRTALLSPFDRLIHARDRAAELFDFEFVIELYKPKAKRRWGYFAMPVLHGDRLIGKIDATAHRDAGALVVHAIHRDVKWSSAMTDAVDAELHSLASWLGLDRVAVDEPPRD